MTQDQQACVVIAAIIALAIVVYVYGGTPSTTATFPRSFTQHLSEDGKV